MEWSYFWSRM